MESRGLYSDQDTWQLPLDFISHNTVHSTHLSVRQRPGKSLTCRPSGFLNATDQRDRKREQSVHLEPFAKKTYVDVLQISFLPNTYEGNINASWEVIIAFTVLNAFKYCKFSMFASSLLPHICWCVVAYRGMLLPSFDQWNSVKLLAEMCIVSPACECVHGCPLVCELIDKLLCTCHRGRKLNRNQRCLLRQCNSAQRVS